MKYSPLGVIFHAGRKPPHHSNINFNISILPRSLPAADKRRCMPQTLQHPAAWTCSAAPRSASSVDLVPDTLRPLPCAARWITAHIQSVDVWFAHLPPLYSFHILRVHRSNISATCSSLYTLMVRSKWRK